MSEYERRYAAAIAELDATGIKRVNYLPPMYRLYRKAGWKVRPPHYTSFFCAVIGQSLFFGVAMGLFLLLNAWQVAFAFARSWPFFLMVLQFGISSGIALSVFYAYGRRKWKLSRWKDL